MPRHAPKKTAKERQLEELLFGKDVVHEITKAAVAAVATTADARPAKRSKNSNMTVMQSQQQLLFPAAWQDEDDEALNVNLSATNRLKKLKRSSDGTDEGDGRIEGKVSVSAFSQLLQERFQTRQLAWAAVTDDADGDADADGSRLLLQRSDSLTESKRRSKQARKTGNSSFVDDAAATGPGALPEGKINIVRLTDANAAEPTSAQEAVSAVQFHPSGRLVMVASGDKVLRFFTVDGDKNEKQLSVCFSDMRIACAAFLGATSEVVVGGRKPFFYTYDTASGAVAKLPVLAGCKGLKSHEVMCASPSGLRVAFAGAGGYVHVVCGRLKTWQLDVKMNCACRAIAFVDDHTLVSSGLDADVYVWDLRQLPGAAASGALGRCVARFHNEDGTCTSAVAASLCAQLQGTVFGPRPVLSSSGGGRAGNTYFAVGSESGVVALYYADLSASVAGGRGGGGGVRPLKALMNLTTKVTCAAFHPSGELLAVASDQKKDQLKLVHLPSGTVYANWPTEKTPLRKVTALAFSPGGGFLAVGNDKGRVLLYRLVHYQSA